MKPSEYALFGVSLIRGFYGQWHFRRIMSGLLIAIAFGLITVLLVAALLVGSFFAVYQALLYYGWTPVFALLCIGGLYVISIAIFAALTKRYMHRLRHTPLRPLGKSTVVSLVNEAADAFLDGFLEEDVVR